jgi:broad specificity phosphatase PhoE
MKRLLLIIGFYMAFIVSPEPGIMVAKGESPDHQDIERIEKKYKEMNDIPVGEANGKPVGHAMRFIQAEDGAVKDYSKLRQIALVRHGEPDMIKTGKFNAQEAQQFLRCYDSVCIIIPNQPFFNFKNQEDVTVFSSPINRALTTAKFICGPEKCITVSPEFREFETSMNTRRSKKRLPIKFWTTTARLKWRFGIGKQNDIESYSDAKKRAKRAAQTLEEASDKNHKVLLTAHGLLNRSIKKNLVKMGWKVVEDNGSAYLGTTILVKIDD